MKRVCRNFSIRGFTIVELLIVVVVIAILATITIIAYNGIRDRARQAANLAVLDQVEKAVRAYQSDNNIVPSVQTTQELNDYVASFIDQNAQVQSAVTDFQNGISRASPVDMQVSLPQCVPGSYPATGIFRDGECLVSMASLTIGSPHLEIRQRMAYTASTILGGQIAPKYITSMPLMNGDGLSFVSTIDNANIVLGSGSSSSTVRGSGSVVIAFRGAVYMYGGGVALLLYYAKGDQRGDKHLVHANDMLSGSTQISPNVSMSSDNASVLTLTAANGDLWTQCVVTIQ